MTVAAMLLDAFSDDGISPVRKVCGVRGPSRLLSRPATLPRNERGQYQPRSRFTATNNTRTHSHCEGESPATCLPVPARPSRSPMPTPTIAPSRPATPGRGGVWEPLPSIIYGYAVHPLSPSHRDTRISSRPRLSTVTQASTASSFIHRDVVALEVGDEVYAFEKYTPRGKETEGVWYRGYVITFILEKTLVSPYHLDMLSVPLDVPLYLGMCRLTHHHPADQGSKNLSKFLSAYSPVHTSSFGRSCLMLREVLPMSRQPSKMTHASRSWTYPSPRLLVLARLRKTTANRSG
jgi:hypothetical protein